MNEDFSHKKIDSDTVRKDFISYFKDRSHQYVAGSNLISKDDSLMFINAGMNQFKQIFLSMQKTDKYLRAVNYQRCLRISGKHNDLDEVGKDNSHHTFFEMLGNWSFGDYYKKDAIKWAWDLLTNKWGLNKKRLFVTVHENDIKSFDIWQNHTDIEKKRILKFKDKDNFWTMGKSGPCGPSSEIHFDTGDLKTQNSTYQDKILGVNGKNDRYLEIWNLVFIQYNQYEDGRIQSLSKKFVDTGMGFERICSILQWKKSNYDSDLFSPLIKNIEILTETKYTKNTSTAYKVIADHLRALVFLIMDGLNPSREGPGYVIRRILRRASRFSHSLGQDKPFIYKLVDSLIEIMKFHYPKLLEYKDKIIDTIRNEEIKFLKTLKQGLIKLDSIKSNKFDKKIIEGEDVFLLYDTYGFPIDLTQQIAEEDGFEIKWDSYHKKMENQKSIAKSSSKFKKNIIWTIVDDKINESIFVGYTDLDIRSRVIRYFLEDNKFLIILDKTPFYYTSGGQSSDIGVLKSDECLLDIIDVYKEGDFIIHECNLKNGRFDPDIIMTASVDKSFRKDTAIHHSATHILHQVLIDQFGPNLRKKGSDVNNTRLRFDFNYDKDISVNEIAIIEKNVNKKIIANENVEIYETFKDEAIKKGAKSLFGEKYENKVRVVKIGKFSIELCGGCHVSNSGNIGTFLILSYRSIGFGIKRIEAVAGIKAIEIIRNRFNLIDNLKNILKTDIDNIFAKTSEMIKSIKNKDKFVKEIQKKYILNFIEKVIAFQYDEKFKLINIDQKNYDKKHLKFILDQISLKLEKGIIIIFHSDLKWLSVLIIFGKKNIGKWSAIKLANHLGDFTDSKANGDDFKARFGLGNLENKKDLIKYTNNFVKKIL